MIKLQIQEGHSDSEPQPDIALCSSCGWKGPVADCESSEEGDYENGYYAIHLCPNCDDGGSIDNYEMTSKRANEWSRWYRRHHPAPDY